MGRVSPGVVRERHCNRNERQQLLRSSAATVFILPFDVRVARMRAHAPIITEVLRLQKVTRRRGRRPRTPSHGQCKCYFCQLILVPTGYFGDVLAGYYSKRMGLPVGDLIVATNDPSACRRRWEAGAGAGAGGGGAAAVDRVAGGEGFVHAPTPNTSKADEVRRRLKDA
jgi:hypothetical protein